MSIKTGQTLAECRPEPEGQPENYVKHCLVLSVLNLQSLQFVHLTGQGRSAALGGLGFVAFPCLRDFFYVSFVKMTMQIMLKSFLVILLCYTPGKCDLSGCDQFVNVVTEHKSSNVFIKQASHFQSYSLNGEVNWCWYETLHRNTLLFPFLSSHTT